jgi:hypothetical protein
MDTKISKESKLKGFEVDDICEHSIGLRVDADVFKYLNRTSERERGRREKKRRERKE